MKSRPVSVFSFGSRLRASSAVLAAAFAALSMHAQTNVSSISGALSVGGANSTSYNLDANFTVTTTADSTLSGVLSGSNSAYTFNKAGSTNLTLSNAANSFTGPVKVSNGAIYVPSVGNTGSNSYLGQNGTISLGSTTSGGTLRLTGTSNETTDKVINLSGTTGGGGITVTGATYTFSSNLGVSGTGNKTFTLASSGGNAGQGIIFNGLIADAASSVISVTANGSGNGTFRLGNSSNSFSGGVTVAGNTAARTYYLEVSGIGNSGANSPLGTNGTIKLGSTAAGSNNVLSYVGTGETTNKVINLPNTVGKASIYQSGTGQLKFTSNLSVTGAGVKEFNLNGSTAGTGEFAGVISDNSVSNTTSLGKGGSGTWTLSAANTYTGGTTISAGRLLVNNATGSGTGTGAVSVSSSAVLGGSGTISGATTLANGASAGAYLAPGATATATATSGGIGLLSFANNLTLTSGAGANSFGSTVSFEINGTTRGTGYDGIDLTGSGKTLAYGGTMSLVFDAPINARTYNLFSLGGNTQSSTFAAVTIAGSAVSGTPSATITASGWSASVTDSLNSLWNLTFTNADGNLQVASAIPEPSTFAVGLGAVALAGVALRRRRRA
jgi:autotransporter-associated beta strand protein